jgi:hypothetical protein
MNVIMKRNSYECYNEDVLQIYILICDKNLFHILVSFTCLILYLCNIIPIVVTNN